MGLFHKIKLAANINVIFLHSAPQYWN